MNSTTATSRILLPSILAAAIALALAGCNTAIRVRQRAPTLASVADADGKSSSQLVPGGWEVSYSKRNYDSTADNLAAELAATNGELQRATITIANWKSAVSSNTVATVSAAGTMASDIAAKAAAAVVAAYGGGASTTATGALSALLSAIQTAQTAGDTNTLQTIYAAATNACPDCVAR